MKGHILHYLENHDFAKRKDVIVFLRGMDIKVSDRLLRKTVDEMIESDGHNIRSSAKGWSLIRTPKEQEAQVKYLRSYIFQLFRRLRASQRNWDRQTARLIPANEHPLTACK